MTLPSEKFTPRGFIRSVVLTGVLFFVFNFALLAIFPALTPRTTVGITNTKYQMLERADGYSGGVILGDSTAFMGVDPDRLERETGMPWLNLATYADFGLFDDAIMLSRMIDNGWHIQGLIVCHTYDTFHRDLGGRAFADIPWYLRLPWQDLPANPPTGSTRRRRDLFPIYYRQNSFWNLVESGPLRWSSWKEQFEKGFFSPKHETPDLERDIGDHTKHLRSKSARKISRSNKQSTATLIKIAEGHDIPLLFVSGPILDSIWKTRRYRRASARIESYLRRKSKGHVDVASDFEDQAVFPAEDMNRVDHVNAAAVEHLTDHVAGQWNRFREEER